MQAREYARSTAKEHVGYVECLRNIRRDHADGKTIDFTDWQDAEKLTNLQEEDFDLLLDMYKDFCGTKQEKVFKTMKMFGLPYGAKRKESENFTGVAESYISGEQNGKEASRNCG